MPSPLQDTIVAPITGVTRAAVAIIRLSGPSAWRIAAKLFHPWPETVRPRYALYGRWTTGDDGLALPFSHGKSFTGEESVEFHLHGSPASVRALVEACVSLGARPADPGEFTYRAFMNGRLDLTQAEGIRDTIEASAQLQLRQANLLRTGKLSDQLEVVERQIVGVLASIEATVDFSEEIGDLDSDAAAMTCQDALQAIELLLEAGERATRIREGFTLAIVGRPNVGKSSLLNHLLQSERAIVTSIAGTTRDTLEEWVELGGLPFKLIDTAGLRDTDDQVEAIGVERSRQALKGADAVWFLYDANEGWSNDDQSLWESLDREAVRVGNKADLGPSSVEEGFLISALSGDGVASLVRHTVASFGEVEPTVGVQPRHLPALDATREAVERARQTLLEPIPVDLASVHLRDALHQLGVITGKSTSIDMVDRIFQDFCIGK